MLAVENNPDQPVSQLIVSWLLMIPLFFFACRGILWFQAAGGNSFGPTGFNTLAAAKSGGEVAVFLTVFLSVLLLLITRLISVLEICWNNWVFVVLALYAMASCAWSQFPTRSLQFGIYIAFNILFAFYLHSRFRPQALMKLFALLGWIVVLSSIMFAVALPKYGIDHRIYTAGSWQGVFIYKNTCSVMATFLLSVAFYMPVYSLRGKLLRAAYVLLTVFLVLMTRARTGWILLAVLLAYVVIMKLVGSFKAGDRMAVVVLLAMVFTVLAVVCALYSREMFVALGKDPTLTGRTEIWKLSVDSAMKRPLFGYGYRAFWTGTLQGESAHIALLEKWTVTGAHNGLLETWLDLGLIGVGMVLIALAVGVRNGVTCLKHGTTPHAKWYLSIIVMTIVSNIAEMTLMFPNYLTWIMCVLACVGLAHESKQIRRQACA
jgi:exopolysaccharide production protein ExoQ